MKAARRQIIRKILQSKPFVSLKELEEHFPEVTSMTLRRDIEYFEQQGELIKVRNGARSMKFIASTADDKYNQREHENEEIKRVLANKACVYLEKGKTLFFDAGSTIMQMAQVMPDAVYNIVTPSPNVALKLVEKNLPIVNLIGGIVNRDSISVTGDMSIQSLQSISIDIAFLVPSGYSRDGGFTCGNFSESELKNYVAKNARKVIMLMDASKYDKNFPYKFCDMSDVDIIITDADLKEATGKAEIVEASRPQIREYVSKCIPQDI